ncbi:MAG: hypothetical protein FD170_3859 [Bacteroidetes bacterium]|nr:MAG: hypothetical protein FD170_3859 [Bacteroidota bacterium]
MYSFTLHLISKVRLCPGTVARVGSLPAASLSPRPETVPRPSLTPLVSPSPCLLVLKPSLVTKRRPSSLKTVPRP